MKSKKTIRTLTRELGENLTAYRLSRNLRQEDLAEQAGVTSRTVNRIETGRGGTIDSLVRITRALGWEDRIASLLPDAHASPLDPRSVGKPRKRASPQRKGENGTNSGSGGKDK